MNTWLNKMLRAACSHMAVIRNAFSRRCCLTLQRFNASTFRILPFRVLVLFNLLTTLATVHGEIMINGVTDKTFYNDRVSFTVLNPSGSDYLVLLNSDSVPPGTAILVDTPGYHEVRVTETNHETGEVTNSLTRFVIVASARGSSERGLPPWTPYPVIPSTAGEAAGALVRLITPKEYPAGLEIPLVAWVENDTGHPVRVNGMLTAPGHPEVVIRRGVGSGLLAAANPGTLDFTGRLINLPVNQSVLIESNTTWTSVSGVIRGPTTWPENSRIAVTNHLTLSPSATLIIGGGSVVRVGAGVNIMVDGLMLINGTLERPVVFTPVQRAQPWGGFYLTNSASQLDATGTLFTGSGANPNGTPNSHRPEQSLFYCDNHALLTLTDCAAIDLAGQFGHGVDRGEPLISVVLTRCLIQRCISGGEWNGSALQLLQSALIEVPRDTPVFSDTDEDGIYFTTGEYVVRDSLIGWTGDDGIDSGSGGGGTVTVSNTWVESTYHEAFAWSGGDRITTNLHTVSINCGQGVECGFSNNANSPSVYVEDCLSTANVIGARFGDNYDWTYNGFLRITNSFLLYNQRDVWGINFQDWTYRTNAMDIQSNFISTAQAPHPDNFAWDSGHEGWRLARFMTTPTDAPVGIGLAVRSNRLELASFSRGVPVRLSSFTTNRVSVNYRVDAVDDSVLTQGILTFAPGETVQWIPFTPELAQENSALHVSIENPVRSEITGLADVWLLDDSFDNPNLTVLIPAGGTWRYLDDGSDPGTQWISLAFNDSQWFQGQAELGYGDDKDGRTEKTLLNYGTNFQDKIITYYFRHPFVVTNLAAFDSLTLKLKRDDGGLVYLNGTEVLRSNMDAGPVNRLTEANNASDDGADFITASVPVSALVPGTNLVAVEIHQDSPTSSDISFDLQLEAQVTPANTPLRIESITLFSGPASILSLRFQAVANQAYTVQYQDTLLGGEWQNLTEVAQAPVARPIEILDPIPPNRSSRFYRILAR